MKTYQNMANEEIKQQLEWSDQHEFSYGYSMWAFDEIEKLNNIIKYYEDLCSKQKQAIEILDKESGKE